MSLPRSVRKLITGEIRLARDCFVNPGHLSPGERKFIDRAMARNGAIVHRASWPDFIVCHKGEFVAVEVKEPGDCISVNQRRTFNLLEDKGLMKVFVWNSATPDKLIAWKNYKNPMKRRGRHDSHNS